MFCVCTHHLSATRSRRLLLHHRSHRDKTTTHSVRFLTCHRRKPLENLSLSLSPPPTNTTIIHLSQLSFLLEVSGEVELPTQKHTHRRMAANVADKFKIIVRFRLYNLGSRARYGSAALFTVYPSIRLRCARVRKAHSKLRTKAKKSVMSENRTPTYGLKEAQLCLNVSKIAQIF